MAVKIEWSDQARADIRALDRPTVLLVFDTLLRYARTGHGDVKLLQGQLEGRLRLRADDYRIFFSAVGDGLRILGVKDRKNAYL